MWVSMKPIGRWGHLQVTWPLCVCVCSTVVDLWRLTMRRRTISLWRRWMVCGGETVECGSVFMTGTRSWAGSGLATPDVSVTAASRIQLHCWDVDNYNKPAITRVQWPMLALFLWLVTVIFWLTKQMGWWNICVPRLVILAASVFEISLFCR